MQRSTESSHQPREAEDGGGDPGPGPDGGRGGTQARRPRSARARRWRRVLAALLAVFALMGAYVGVTLTPYLTAPGTDSVAARVAEWGRDHHLSWAVTWLENETYAPPPVGGTLSASQQARLKGLGHTPSPGTHPAPSATTTPPDLPTNITPLAASPLPGEGVWHPTVLDAAGNPVIEQAALRPDPQHTSQLAYAVWMNQRGLTFTLQPGYQQPGGSWASADQVGGSALAGLVATFNGGFKIHPDDALGGYYADGKTASPLVDGKAAEVFYRDGSMKIGTWGADLTMTPQVAAVRENLSPLVAGGRVQVASGAGSSAQWGYTINNDYFIARSGVGMTANGDLVYVSGPTLSVHTLAVLLKDAGAVDAMELDINPDWVSYMFYSGNRANPSPAKLWDFVQPANRYLQPSDRDFVSVHLK